MRRATSLVHISEIKFLLNLPSIILLLIFVNAKKFIMLMLYLEQARGHHVGDPCYKLSQTNPPSKRIIARQYKVSDCEATIRKVWAKREVFHKRSALMSKETKKKKIRACVGRSTEMEDKLYL